MLVGLCLGFRVGKNVILDEGVCVGHLMGEFDAVLVGTSVGVSNGFRDGR